MANKRLKSCDASNDSNPESSESGFSDTFLRIEFDLSRELGNLTFGPPVQYVYNPLEYAKELHVKFVEKYFRGGGEKIVFLGMNPGPWGMCQTGIPFGECKIVNEWFDIEGTVGHPENEHPLRKVSGLKCKRSEVSGKKFWGLMRKICVTPENFFRHCIVYNLCPLAFLMESGKNITPTELKINDRRTIIDYCEKAFVDIVVELKIKLVVAIGNFAEKTAITALKKKQIDNVKVSSIPHPSPRNAKNFSNWEETTVKKLQELGVFHLLNENN